MRRKENYPLQKVTLNLRAGDFERLRNLHGRLGAGKVVRELVMGHIKRVEEAVGQKISLTDQLEMFEGGLKHE
jgi:hypothetical protein